MLWCCVVVRCWPGLKQEKAVTAGANGAAPSPRIHAWHLPDGRHKKGKSYPQKRLAGHPRRCEDTSSSSLLTGNPVLATPFACAAPPEESSVLPCLQRLQYASVDPYHTSPYVTQYLRAPTNLPSRCSTTTTCACPWASELPRPRTSETHSFLFLSTDFNNPHKTRAGNQVCHV